LAVLSGLMIVGFAPRAWLSPKSEPNVTVAGEVTDAAIGQPVSGARVADNRYGAGAVARQEAWTAATGRYSLRTWYEEHALAASAPGYYTRLETLLTKPVGRASELRMDFQLQPTNSPTARQ
jgi:hypothetical protein